MQKCPLFIMICVLAIGGVAQLSADDEKSRDDRKHSESGDRGKGSVWESLSDEQKMQLREALRDVWSDPAVLSAREDVKQASDAYQAAVREAVRRADPEVADLVVKLQSSSEGKARERIGGPSKFGMRRSGDYPMGPPGYLDGLSDEERARFKKVQEQARESAAVKEARKELEELHARDNELRRRRLMAHRKLRKAIMESMVEIDPEIEALQKRVYNGERRGRPGPRDGKGPQNDRE